MVTIAPVNRYSRRFDQIRQVGRRAFIPFTVLGYPDEETCYRSIKLMIDSGATALELGVAFSDPVADGPIIQKASFQTLNAGFGVNDGFRLIQKIRSYDRNIPIGLLVYYNVVLARADTFCQEAAAAGVDSVLIADLPPDSAEEVVPAAIRSGIAPVFIVSPLTDDQRLQHIVGLSQAYIYVVSRLGITGTEDRQDEHLEDLLRRAKRCTELPLCVGFGVSSPQHACKMFALGADGVITGSRIVELVTQDLSLGSLTHYLEQMVQVCRFNI